ncbi:ribokinase [Proteiniclasticum sp. SCR006]|uniref:Ribokinase n=1 Tax=Proteiniclasticum aestuarii TaxID=2817862 RepID=A0A939KH53_9CLOT|nr:ribokinase [Proteiniclasticum aestuarii]MBO1265109.1 ribokinase [Proteiniclasticum aestuarii]
MNKRILVIGSINIDLSIASSCFPKKGETVKGKDFFKTVGGKGLNQAVAAHKFGQNVCFCGNIGFDHDAAMVYEILERYGLGTEHIKRDGQTHTGSAIIVRAEEDNAIIIDEGANGTLDFGSVRETIDSVAPDYVMLQFELSHEVNMNIIRYCYDRGIKVVLNTAPASDMEEEVLKCIDTLILNQTEVEYYTGNYPSSETEAFAASQYFLDRGVVHVVVTLGDHGSIYAGKEKRIFQKAYKSNVIDSTGAGDAFTGVYVSAISKYGDVKKALQFANAAGGLTCEKNGAIIASPTYREIENKILEEENNEKSV